MSRKYLSESKAWPWFHAVQPNKPIRRHGQRHVSDLAPEIEKWTTDELKFLEKAFRWEIKTAPDSLLSYVREHPAHQRRPSTLFIAGSLTHQIIKYQKTMQQGLEKFIGKLARSMKHKNTKGVIGKKDAQTDAVAAGIAAVLASAKDRLLAEEVVALEAARDAVVAGNLAAAATTLAAIMAAANARLLTVELQNLQDVLDALDAAELLVNPHEVFDQLRELFSEGKTAAKEFESMMVKVASEAYPESFGTGQKYAASFFEKPSITQDVADSIINQRLETNASFVEKSLVPDIAAKAVDIATTEGSTVADIEAMTEPLASRISMYAMQLWGMGSTGFASEMVGQGQQLWWIVTSTNPCSDCPGLEDDSPYDAENPLPTYPGWGDTECRANCLCLLVTSPAIQLPNGHTAPWAPGRALLPVKCDWGFTHVKGNDCYDFVTDTFCTKYSEDQPRDDHGRWTSDGGGGSTVAEEHFVQGYSNLSTGPSGRVWHTPTRDYFIASRNESKRVQYMSPLSAEDLQSSRLFMSKDGKIGFSVSGDGDIQNVFNNSDEHGAGVDAIVDAVAHGGRTLDCYDKYLPKLYSQMGFVETSRMKFNPEQAPSTWPKDGGKPDVVFMAWKGDNTRPKLEELQRIKDQSQWRGHAKTNVYYTSEQWDKAKADSRRAVGDRHDGKIGGASAYARGRVLSNRAGKGSWLSVNSWSAYASLSVFAKYSEDQPRDDHGRWIEEGFAPGGEEYPNRPPAQPQTPIHEDKLLQPAHTPESQLSTEPDTPPRPRPAPVIPQTTDQLPAGGPMTQPGGGIVPFNENAYAPSPEEYPDRPPAVMQPPSSDNAEQQRLMNATFVKTAYLGGGISDSYRVQLADGTEGVWKPNTTNPFSPSPDYINETAAYDLAKEIGYDDISAPVVTREITDIGENNTRVDTGKITGNGSLMVFMKQGSGDAYPEKISNTVDNERAKALDYAMGQLDRDSSHNWLIMPDGKPMLIDNGRSMPGYAVNPDDRKRYSFRSDYEWGIGHPQSIPDHVHETFAKANANWDAIAERMGRNGLDKNAIEAAHIRVAHLAVEKTWADLTPGDNENYKTFISIIK